jgi:epoxyqueuosine reductase
VRLLDDASPLVRAMAVWARGCLLSPEAVTRHAGERLAQEADLDVREEWSRALQGAALTEAAP